MVLSGSGSDGVRCPNPHQSPAIGNNHCSDEKQPTRSTEPNANFSNSLRRESLYPAELSGRQVNRGQSLLSQGFHGRAQASWVYSWEAEELGLDRFEKLKQALWIDLARAHHASHVREIQLETALQLRERL